MDSDAVALDIYGIISVIRIIFLTLHRLKHFNSIK